MTYGHRKQNRRIFPIAVFLPSGFELMKPEQKITFQSFRENSCLRFWKTNMCHVMSLGLCLGTIYDGLLTQREWKSGSEVRWSQFPQLAWKEVVVREPDFLLTNQGKVLEMPPYLKTFQRKADWLQRWREQGERCRQGRGGQWDRARTSGTSDFPKNWTF